MGGSKQSQGPLVSPMTTDRKFRQDDEHINDESKQDVAATKKQDESMIPESGQNPEAARRKKGGKK